MIAGLIKRAMDASSSLLKSAPTVASLEKYDQPDGKHREGDNNLKWGFWAWIRSIDMFPKFDSTYLRQTSSGGVGSVLCFTIMALLMAIEGWRYLIPVAVQEFEVDSTIRESMPLKFSVSVGSPCGALTVLLVDKNNAARMLGKGERGEILMEDILLPKDLGKDKIRLLTEEEEELAEISDEQMEGFHVGCRISTPIPIEIPRAESKLAILPITDFMGILGAMIMQQDTSINFSHIIHHMSFGRDYPGQLNPLNGLSQPAMQFHEDFMYMLSILPTRYYGGFLRRGWLESSQYALTGFLGKKAVENVEKPGLYFDIRMDGLGVRIGRERMGFKTFMIHLVGILGGIYCVFGMINSMLVTVYDWLWGRRDAAGLRRRSSAWSSDGSVSMTSVGVSVYDQLVSKRDPNMAV